MREIRAFVPKEKYGNFKFPEIEDLTFVLYDDTFNIPENCKGEVFISASGLKDNENTDSFKIIRQLVLFILGEDE